MRWSGEDMKGYSCPASLLGLAWLGLFAQNTFLSAALKPWRLDPLQV